MRFLVLQHLDVEHPGIFRDFMREEGIEWDAVELDEGEVLPVADDYHALIVMGGPMDVWEESDYPWLAPEKRFIRDWVDSKRPFLGVCLGHQLLADALDGKVGKATTSEVGVLQVNLTETGKKHPYFDQVSASFDCLQWHGAEVIEAPQNAAVLAESDACAIQALSIGNHAFSFQFHVEVTESTVDEWAEIEAYQDALQQNLGDNGLALFREAASSHMQAFNQQARRLYDNWRKHAFSTT